MRKGLSHTGRILLSLLLIFSLIFMLPGCDLATDIAAISGIAEDDTSDAGIAGADAPDADFAEDDAPDADFAEDDAPDAGIAGADAPDADIAEDDAPDADIAEDDDPDAGIAVDDDSDAGIAGDDASDAGMDQEAEDVGDSSLREDGSYTTKEDVALYLHIYGHLPPNFITKKEAKALGWQGGGLDNYKYGACIGGDRFGNFEGNLPVVKGVTYKECDIDTLHKNKRGIKRIIYSSDGKVYYTGDHYNTFELLYE